MKELLEKLNESLCDTLLNQIGGKKIQYFDDNSTIDSLATILSLEKNQKTIYELMLSSSIPIEKLQYLFNDVLNESIKKGYIILGSNINSDKAFIGTNGLFELYIMNEYNLNESFKLYDSKRFQIENLFLKPQEKIWCVFLILFGADRESSIFNSEGLTPHELKNYHVFLKSIEEEIHKQSLNIGKNIGWDTGKDAVFRKFITNNVDLPKTGIYKKKGQWQYYLDLSSKKNTKFILDLILNEYDGADRLIANLSFYEALKELELKISINLGLMPGKINKFVIELLNN